MFKEIQSYLKSFFLVLSGFCFLFQSGNTFAAAQKSKHGSPFIRFLDNNKVPIIAIGTAPLAIATAPAVLAAGGVAAASSTGVLLPTAVGIAGMHTVAAVKAIEASYKDEDNPVYIGASFGGGGKPSVEVEAGGVKTKMPLMGPNPTPSNPFPQIPLVVEPPAHSEGWSSSSGSLMSEGPSGSSMSGGSHPISSGELVSVPAVTLTVERSCSEVPSAFGPPELQCREQIIGVTPALDPRRIDGSGMECRITQPQLVLQSSAPDSGFGHYSVPDSHTYTITCERPLPPIPPLPSYDPIAASLQTPAPPVYPIMPLGSQMSLSPFPAPYPHPFIPFVPQEEEYKSEKKEAKGESPAESLEGSLEEQHEQSLGILATEIKPTLRAASQAIEDSLRSWNSSVPASQRKFVYQEISEYGKLIEKLNTFTPLCPEHQTWKEMAEAISQIGLELLNQSAQRVESFVLENQEEVLIARDIATSLVDLGISFSPASPGKDAYEAITGRNLITGESLTSLERDFAVVGVMTLGTGNKIAAAGKTLKKITTALKQKFGEAFVRRGMKSSIHSASIILAGARKVERFHPLRPGPLHAIAEGAGTVADTFRSSSYLEIVTNEPVKLYRVYGTEDRALSFYWSRVKPTGPYQAVLDSALDPVWGNSAKKWVEITVPAGEKFYEGVVSEVALIRFNNPIPVGQLLGGGNQVYIKGVNETWITGRGVF